MARDPFLRIIRPRRWLHRLLAVIAIFVLAACLLPYALPLSRASSLPFDSPYDNSQVFEVDGIMLHSRIWPAEGNVWNGKILLIHGLGGSTYSWDLTAPELASAGYQVIAADLPGFGFSSRQAGIDHSQANRARLLWLLLDQADAQQPVDDNARSGWIIAGHSMGGGTAAAMALARQDRTERLIIVDGALSDNRPAVTGYLLAIPPARRWLALALEHVLINEANVKSLLTATHGQLPTEERLAAYLVPLQISGTAGALVDFTRTARSEPAAALRNLTFPIDAVWGSEDTIVPIEEAHRLQQLIPSMRLQLIDGAGHLPMETHAVEFNQLLLEILKKQD